MKKNYNILLNVSPLQDGNSKRGVGFYTSRLLLALNQVTKTNPNYKYIKIYKSGDDIPKDIDLVHYPFFDLFTRSMPAKKLPTVVTVHDLIPLDLKSNYPVGIKGTINWHLQKHRLRQVDFIITDSVDSKFSIHKHTGFPLDYIYSIYLAADAIFKPIKKVAKKNFVLYTGDINYNKNVVSLAKLCVKNKLPLIIVGKTAAETNIISHPWTKDLRELKSLQQQHPSLIKTVGYLDSNDLNTYYNQARLYCQPSYAEGFGLPLLEAMQAGCPVVYSNKSSLAEIGNHVGLQFDPYDPINMEKQILKMWNSQSERNKSVKDGLKQARLFSWEDTAIQSLEVYKLALLKYDKS